MAREHDDDMVREHDDDDDEDDDNGSLMDLPSFRRILVDRSQGGDGTSVELDEKTKEDERNARDQVSQATETADTDTVQSRRSNIKEDVFPSIEDGTEGPSNEEDDDEDLMKVVARRSNSSREGSHSNVDSAEANPGSANNESLQSHEGPVDSFVLGERGCPLKRSLETSSSTDHDGPGAFSVAPGQEGGRHSPVQNCHEILHNSMLRIEGPSPEPSRNMSAAAEAQRLERSSFDTTASSHLMTGGGEVMPPSSPSQDHNLTQSQHDLESLRGISQADDSSGVLSLDASCLMSASLVEEQPVHYAEVVTERSFWYKCAPLCPKSKWGKVSCLLAFMVLLVIGSVTNAIVARSTGSGNEDSGSSDAALVPQDTSPVLAQVPHDICYDRIPGQGRSNVCTPQQTQEQGGGVANVVAFATLAFSTLMRVHAHISLVNAGEVEYDILQGTFTEEDLDALLPFDHSALVVLNMTGTQIIQVLEEALQHIVEADATGAYPYASGLRYSVDYGKDFPNRTSNVEVNLEGKLNVTGIHGTWHTIEREREYSVVTNPFLAAGGDGYLEMTRVDPAKIRQTFFSRESCMRNYLLALSRKQQELLDRKPELYSTQSFHAGPYNFTGK